MGADHQQPLVRRQLGERAVHRRQPARGGRLQRVRHGGATCAAAGSSQEGEGGRRGTASRIVASSFRAPEKRSRPAGRTAGQSSTGRRDDPLDTPRRPAYYLVEHATDTASKPSTRGIPGFRADRIDEGSRRSNHHDFFCQNRLLSSAAAGAGPPRRRPRGGLRPHQGDRHQRRRLRRRLLAARGDRAANQHPGEDAILLHAGTYTLGRPRSRHRQPARSRATSS